MKAVIIGAGELGTVMGSLIKERAEVSFWDTDPTKTSGEPLEAILPSADLVFFCIPSWTLREAIKGVAPLLKSDCSLISFSKGIEDTSLKVIPELFTELAPQFPFAVIGGPMLAEEIKAGKATVGVIASKNDVLKNILSDLFSTPQFRVELSDDPFGVSLAGVLKNVYAVSLGIADGLDLSDNQKGWLTSQAIQEMVEAGKIFGIDEKIILGTAGIGDFVATSFSAHSRNREVGHQIVKLGMCNVRGEGLSSLPALMNRLGEKAPHFLLLNFINEVGINCQPAGPAFQSLFNAKN